MLISKTVLCYVHRLQKLLMSDYILTEYSLILLLFFFLGSDSTRNYMIWMTIWSIEKCYILDDEQQEPIDHGVNFGVVPVIPHTQFERKLNKYKWHQDSSLSDGCLCSSNNRFCLKSTSVVWLLDMHYLVGPCQSWHVIWTQIITNIVNIVDYVSHGGFHYLIIIIGHSNDVLI